MVQDSEITLLEADRQSQAGEVLARAFHGDPLYMLVMPEGGKRAGVALAFR